MVHPQGQTPMQTYNSTASGIINKTVKQRRSKAIDMRFNWVRGRCKQTHFRIYWAPGKYNMGDYHTNFHPPLHHKKKQTLHMHTEKSHQYIPWDTSTLQKGCAKQFIVVNIINMFRRKGAIITRSMTGTIIRSVQIYCAVKYWQRA